MIERVKDAIKAVKQSSNFERDSVLLFLKLVVWYYAVGSKRILPQEYVRFIEHGETSSDKLISEIAELSICDQARLLADVIAEYEFARFNGSRSGLGKAYELIRQELNI
jgi:hypothetical protein